jgi:hypothetical protein
MSAAAAAKGASIRLGLVMPYINIALLTVISVLGFFIKGEISEFREAQDRIAALEQFRAAHEANQFTSKDGQEIWREMARLQSAIPKEVPPSWLLDDFSELKTKLDEVVKIVAENQRTIGRLEARISSANN